MQVGTSVDFKLLSKSLTFECRYPHLPDESEDLKKYPKGHCPVGGKSSLGMDTNTHVAYDHWLFDVAERLGYITFFGEEFCYEESPYVVQSQSPFTLRVDLSLERIHCQLAKNWLRANGQTNS